MSDGWAAVERALAEAVEAGAFPGASLLVGHAGGVHAEIHAGTLDSGDSGDSGSAGPAVGAETVFDTASLTKPLVTAVCALRLVAAGRLDLDAPVATYLGEFAAAGSDERRLRVTVAQLLGHASGLPAHRHYYRDCGQAALDGRAADAVVRAAIREPLDRDPGSTAVYSDIGFLVLGRLIETVGQCSLADQARSNWLERLDPSRWGLFATGSNDSLPRPADVASIAPTGRCPWRGRTVRGEVQDENAYAAGGLAGHAGLFASARAVHELVAAYVAAADGDDALLPGALVRRCWGTSCASAASTWRMGWDTPSQGASSAGARVSADAVGHLGYTGTSVWVDRLRRCHVVLLTNRVHPDPENTAIRDWRPRIHDAVFGALEA